MGEPVSLKIRTDLYCNANPVAQGARPTLNPNPHPFSSVAEASRLANVPCQAHRSSTLNPASLPHNQFSETVSSNNPCIRSSEEGNLDVACLPDSCLGLLGGVNINNNNLHSPEVLTPVTDNAGGQFHPPYGFKSTNSFSTGNLVPNKVNPPHNNQSICNLYLNPNEISRSVEQEGRIQTDTQGIHQQSSHSSRVSSSIVPLKPFFNMPPVEAIQLPKDPSHSPSTPSTPISSALQSSKTSSVNNEGHSLSYSTASTDSSSYSTSDNETSTKMEFTTNVTCQKSPPPLHYSQAFIQAKRDCYNNDQEISSTKYSTTNVFNYEVQTKEDSCSACFSQSKSVSIIILSVIP